MATLKVSNSKGKYRNEDAIDNAINYILNEQKTPHHCVGGSGVDMSCPVEDMKNVREKFGKQKGVQLRHQIISFEEKELSNPYIANSIGKQISESFGKEYQTIYAVHENKDNIHIHFISNIVSFIDGHRYYGRRKEFYNDKNMMKKVLNKHNISTLYDVK